ncbi:hypothetical protein F2Q69_00063299 [Brassica cretica]|uniref:Uncharacterized protein n=1 Tax=Brassica cretica TaxID=69181 RepID=A0A8S9RRC1_BRACR|nr:hypothetical protein F2Q69_00063299 [Brassica cretica]
MESQIESHLTKREPKRRTENEKADEKQCCQSHRFPEANADETGDVKATVSQKPKLATSV